MILSHFLPPPDFDHELRSTKAAVCHREERSATDSPEIIGNATRHGNNILLSLTVLAFGPASDQLLPSDHRGRLFISLDQGPTLYVYAFTTFTNSNRNLFLFHDVSIGQHRIIYGLQNQHGVVSYGQVCL